MTGATTTTSPDFRELEQLYAERPSAYRRMVARWIALGYAYVFVTIALIVVFVGGGALLFATGTISLLLVDNFIKFVIPLLIVAGLMLRAVFTRLPRPQGVYLEGHLKDRVLQAFEDVRQRAGGKPIDEVVIVNQLNAAVTQIPRFGLFGPTTNYLILGAPLLQLMSEDEVKAVIAHEFGHLSHEHGRMGSVAYRLDQTLTAAARAMDEKGRSGIKGMSFRFLDWFYHNFNRVTFAMRRGQEYEADRVAASATSADAIGSALCRLYALDEPLDGFWRGLWERSSQLAENATIFPQEELQRYVRDAFNPERAQQAVFAALQRETDYSDSHPCLRERLQALETDAATEFDMTRGALNAWLSKEEIAALLSPVDSEWQAVSASAWRQSHAGFRESRSQLAELRKRKDHDRDSLLQMAGLEESLEGQDSSMRTYAWLVEQYPDDAYVQYQWGRVNTGRDHPVAARALLRAAEIDITFTPDARQLLQGTPAEDDSRLAELGRTWEEECRLANAERESVSVEDDLIAVDLNEEFRQALVAHAGNYSEIRRLFLVEKPVQHMQHERVFLLAFDINFYNDNVETNEANWLARVTNDFSATFPGLNRPYSTLVGKKSGWAKRLTEIEGALVYEGSGKSKRSTWGWIKLMLYIIVIVAVAYAVIFGGPG